MWGKQRGFEDADGNVLNLVIHDGFTPGDIRELKRLSYANKPNEFKVVTDHLEKAQMDALVELLKTYAKRMVIWKTIELEDDDSTGRNITPLVRVVNEYQLCSHLKLTSEEDWEDFNTTSKQSHFLASLSKNHNLKSLEVHFNVSFFTEGDLAELCEVLRTSSTLEEIGLVFEEEKEFKAFLPAIGKNTSLKRINLNLPGSDCDRWIQALVSEICKHPQINEISLQGSRVGDSGLRALIFLLECSQLKSLFMDFSLSGQPQTYSGLLKGLASQTQMTTLGLPKLIDGLSFVGMMQVALQLENLDLLHIARYQEMDKADLEKIATATRSRRAPLTIALPSGAGKDHADSLERILIAHPGIHFCAFLLDVPKDSRLAFRNRFNLHWRLVQIKAGLWPWALLRARRHPDVVFELIKGKVLGGRESLEEQAASVKQVVSKKRKLRDYEQGNQNKMER